jgi:hypothetical protein
LDDYIDVINSIYKRANINLESSEQLIQINDLWNKKLKFKLAKNYPLKPLNQGLS